MILEDVFTSKCTTFRCNIILLNKDVLKSQVTMLANDPVVFRRLCGRLDVG